MQVRMALERVDNFKSLPVLGSPPGARPAWVAADLPRYFPPHTTYRHHSRTKRNSPKRNGGRQGRGGWFY